MAAELISLSTGLDWIKKLWGILGKQQESYRKELEEINNTILNDPLDIAKYYIEPECQDSNPADHPEEDHPVTKSPIMTLIDNFFKYTHAQLGGNQMIILSDAGMGKTALLTMLKLKHLDSLLIKDKDCILKKLGKTTLDEIAKIENKPDTILLLDSLDEDIEAFGRVRDRLVDILKATQDFHKTIITCRTQFFPDSDPFNLSGRVKISGFVCPAKYLSFFSSQKVEEYIKKRFPKKYVCFFDTQKIEAAQKVMAKMGLLRCRPMLLSYIEDLMERPKIEKASEYHVYDALVQGWLNRQKSKPNADVTVEALLKASIILATVMQSHGKRTISEHSLDTLINQMTAVLPVTKIEIEGKSLINCNSEKHYRFSHYSIQEFLVAKLLLEKPEGKYGFTPKHEIRMTDFIVRMISMSGKVPNFIELLDFKGMNLIKANLKGIQLPGADLSHLDFSDADLSNANLSGANISNTKFNCAILKGIELPGADLSHIDFSGADLRNANLRGANISNTKFDGAKQTGCQFESKFSFEKNIGLVFVYIPPGEFMMGSPDDELGRGDDEKLHKVTLTKGFYMQTTPVTEKQWKVIMDKDPIRARNHPVVNITWHDAQRCIKRLNNKENSNAYRLPTEAEWEYACRAGTTEPFFFGRCLSTDQANYDGSDFTIAGCPLGNALGMTSPVYNFDSNIWGLYDMHGNVWEWCQDWYVAYKDYDETNPVRNDLPIHVVNDLPIHVPKLSEVTKLNDSNIPPKYKRVVRGGSWNNMMEFCRSAARFRYHSDSENDNIGFRLVRSSFEDCED